MIYGAIFGYLLVLAVARWRGGGRWLASLLALALLVAGFGARLVLGAHWPSDILVSYLLALLWAALLLRWLPRRDSRLQ